MKSAHLHTITAACVLLGTVLTLPADAGWFTLTQGNSSATVDSDSDYGIDNLSNGLADHLYQHWFWYRTSTNSAEIPITTSTMTTLFETQSSSNTIDLGYASTNFNAFIDITLHDSPTGPDTVGCTAMITISNTQASLPLEFHLFAYTDFDLNDSIDDAWVQIDSDGAVQAIGGIVSRETLTPVADSYAVDVYPSLVDSLNDSGPSNLNNTASLGPADNTYAHQWDRVMAAGESFTVKIEMEVAPTTNFTLRAQSAANDTFRLTWGSNPVEFYTVQSRTNLMNGGWADVPGLIAMPGEIGAMSVDIVTNIPSVFYRIVNVIP
jgi:hypothetical protein